MTMWGLSQRFKIWLAFKTSPHQQTEKRKTVISIDLTTEIQRMPTRTTSIQHCTGGPSQCSKESKRNKKHGLPWWRSGWESACQYRGHGFEPWSGKIPHAAEQLGPWATITEPARLEPVLRNKRGRDGERPAHHDEEWPPLAATRESPRTETKT